MDGFAKETFSPITKRVQRNGLTFPVLIWGPEGGRPILLLHGFPQEPSTWAPIAEALCRDGFRAVAPVQRGYAASSRPLGDSGYSFEQFVGDALSIADAIGLGTFDVAGFGIGGAQAWMLAAYHPTRVRSLTSFRYPHPAAFAQTMQSDPEQKEKWLRLQQELGAGDPGEKAAAMLANDAAGLRRFLAASGLPQPFLDRYVLRLQEPGALAGALFWNQAVSLDEFARVPAVSASTLLIWSDGPALARAAVEATRSFVRGRFTEISIPEGGHFMLETAPGALVAPLRQHLQSST
jgi:pimeloyl-ACP methyl ester carboxylesterase